MALYLLPTPKNGYVEHVPKTLAKSRFAMEIASDMPASSPAIHLGKAKRFTKWKAFQVESIKGAMRWK